MIQSPKKRGRPRAFDPAVVLERATETFLKFGYSGASLDALTTSMGLNKPSLYAAFGDKRALFVRVLEDRANQVAKRIQAAFARGESLQGSLQEAFLEAVEIYTADDAPPGCLIVSGSSTEAVVDEGLAQFSREFFARCDHAVARWFTAKVPGGGDVSALNLSRLFNGVIHDIALRARVGESRARLRDYAEGAARALTKAAG